MSSYENYIKVKELIEARRSKAISIADIRNAELREKSKKIAEIDRELEGTGFKIFSAACRGEDIEPLKARNLELLAARKKEIKRLGLPEDYTEVHYTCKKCSDTGFIGGSKICSCFREALITENIKSSGIGALIEKQSFENFDLNWYKNEPERYERMGRNIKMAKSFSESFEKDGINLLLIGGTGTGKTHISTAIAKAAIMRGFDVIYDSAQNIISDFEADHFKSGWGQYEQKGAKYLECDLLILDDLGSEFITQFSISALYNLFNTRQNKGLSTVISTNLTPDMLMQEYKDRICSRIIGRNSTILNFDGLDRRVLG